MSVAGALLMLEAQHLSKWYGGLHAVSDVSFTISPGEVLGYLGPNGSGKSTTVGMITGLLEPTSGTILFAGRPVAEDPVEFRRHVGYVPESGHFYPYLSGREHLELVAQLRDMDDGISRARIDALLELFGLHNDAAAPLSSYSKGMRQKILIAAALLGDPALLVFDEPASGLDSTSTLVFRHLVTELSRAGKAVLYSSHELDSVEKCCSRVLVLHRGVVVAHDTVERLRQALSSESLEAVFEQLVCDSDPSSTARDLVESMRLGA
jgi:ABC-2 type transport system ATP-binding protein